MLNGHFVINEELVVELPLTDPLCPFFDTISGQVVASVSAGTGHQRVTVDISGAVAWDPTRLRRGLPGTIATAPAGAPAGPGGEGA